MFIKQLCLIFLLFIIPLQGFFVFSKDLSVLKQHALNLNENDLVVFDIDNTLLTYKDHALRFHQRDYLKKRMRSYHISISYYDYLWSVILQNASWRIIDPEIYSILHILKEKNVKVIACTSCNCNQFGIIDNLANWRLEEFKRQNIHFEYSFPQFPLIKLLSTHCQKTCLFKKGILLTNKLTKGESIKLFLQATNFTPKKIIFIDDKKHFVVDVENAFKNSTSEFIGIEYDGISSLNNSLDYSLIDFQVKKLIQEHVWTNDSDAKRLIKK